MEPEEGQCRNRHFGKRTYPRNIFSGGKFCAPGENTTVRTGDKGGREKDRRRAESSEAGGKKKRIAKRRKPALTSGWKASDLQKGTKEALEKEGREKEKRGAVGRVLTKLTPRKSKKRLRSTYERIQKKGSTKGSGRKKRWEGRKR